MVGYSTSSAQALSCVFSFRIAVCFPLEWNFTSPWPLLMQLPTSGALTFPLPTVGIIVTSNSDASGTHLAPICLSAFPSFTPPWISLFCSFAGFPSQLAWTTRCYKYFNIYWYNTSLSKEAYTLLRWLILAHFRYKNNALILRATFPVWPSSSIVESGSLSYRLSFLSLNGSFSETSVFVSFLYHFHRSYRCSYIPAPQGWIGWSL